MRSATGRGTRVGDGQPVSIHALLAECDGRRFRRPGGGDGFNPRTPCGVRRERRSAPPHGCPFQSTHSLRSATPVDSPGPYTIKFQSTHSLRSATVRLGVERFVRPVSIHALLAECDPVSGEIDTHFPVSIHALLAECDMASPFFPGVLVGFNPRTPCGVRPSLDKTEEQENQVSIHALLAECDMNILLGFYDDIQFQSTHSLRSATHNEPGFDAKIVVSIHALLAECDMRVWPGDEVLWGFNPRTPCGVRHNGQTAKNRANTFQSTHSLRSATRINAMRSRSSLFQSTHSLRSATIHNPKGLNVQKVSIHALLAECDVPERRRHNLSGGFQSTHSLRSATIFGFIIAAAAKGFNPRTPCGVRHPCVLDRLTSTPFQSTHSLRSATDAGRVGGHHQKVSIHALLAECDNMTENTRKRKNRFQSTHSLRSAT